MKKINITFVEYGYFFEGTVAKIKEKLNGKTAYEVEIGWSGTGPNCVLNVTFNCRYTTPTIREDLKQFFINLVITEFVGW